MASASRPSYHRGGERQEPSGGNKKNGAENNPPEQPRTGQRDMNFVVFFVVVVTSIALSGTSILVVSTRAWTRLNVAFRF